MKSVKNLKSLIICIALPLLIGALSGFVTNNTMEQFSNLNQPPLSPPGWLFPIVWTILYIAMGVASYLVLVSNENNQTIISSLRFYVIQLIFNFFWPVIFFVFEWYLFAFIWLVALWVLIGITTYKFFGISKVAGYLMIPYLLWVTFAGYLNLGIYLLN